MDREYLRWLIDQARRDPGRAGPICAQVVAHLQKARRESYSPPAGYLYAGSHRWTARVEGLAVEPVPTAAQPNNPSISDSISRPISIRIPFDAIIWAVVGAANLHPAVEVGSAAVARAPNARCGRDLFSTDWMLEGKVAFTTNGDDRMMVPAAVCVGTADTPRFMGWTVRRNDTILVRFRNLINFWWEGVAFQGFEFPTLDAEIVFWALNLEGP